jgi:hypothetical protein
MTGQEREALLRATAQELADATDVLVPPFEPSDSKLRRILGARANVRTALAACEEPRSRVDALTEGLVFARGEYGSLRGPRRWTLVAGDDTVLIREVPVREDVVTDEDVEAVAIFLNGGSLTRWKERAEARDEGGKDQYRRRAREILGLVLGSGKGGEDG